MKRMATAFTVLVAIITLAAGPASAELRSEPWACFARGYIQELTFNRVGGGMANQARSIRGRIQPAQQGAETPSSFALYEIVRADWGMYLRHLITVTEVDEGFGPLLAKAAGGEFPIALASYGGGCPKNGNSIRGADSITVLDYDLEPLLEEPREGGGGRD